MAKLLSGSFLHQTAKFLETCWFIVLFSTVLCTKINFYFFQHSQTNFLNVMLFYYKLIDMGGPKGGGVGPPCPCPQFAPPEKNIDGDKVHFGNQAHAKV